MVGLEGGWEGWEGRRGIIRLILLRGSIPPAWKAVEVEVGRDIMVLGRELEVGIELEGKGLVLGVLPLRMAFILILNPRVTLILTSARRHLSNPIPTPSRANKLATATPSPMPTTTK